MPETPGDQTVTTSAAMRSTVTIGPYRLTQLLGMGGMGEVWRAEQTHPFHRTVALKLIKAGMDTRAVVARFDSERQALALMEHPNIAKVFDASATDAGRPYFVMEYVPGLPITEYCDKHRLTIRQRLELFVKVCEGVQHAHQKGIIHRDLKPSNVLVEELDQKPVPKIIDFGLAKAVIGTRLTDATMFTEAGGVVGTPDYMSPEQADREPNIDTRTDVYSLGIILYELLVGTLPFAAEQLRQNGVEAMLQKICHEEPPRPSTRLKSLGKSSTNSAANRREEPQTLERRLRGELDWITIKALEKDRNRRYGSPSELAADVDRYLRDQPVLAGAPSAAYRAGKFVKRHRLVVGVAALVLVLLLAFAVTMAFQARRIAKERDRANREAEASKRVSDFMANMFKVSDPGEARGNTVTAREILDHAEGLECLAILILDQLLHRQRGVIESRVERHAVVAQAWLALGIEAEDPDILPFMTDGHQHGLAAVEQVGIRVQRLVVFGGRDDDLESGIGLGQLLRHFGRPLDHQDLVVALRHELGEHVA